MEPGQDDKLKNAGENDLITMRVMTSKGEDGEVPAGTLVNVSVHDLQDFDSGEFPRTPKWTPVWMRG